jgi:radical SAM superfamily enzyme YgiQ (UPF0313 family)
VSGSLSILFVQPPAGAGREPVENRLRSYLTLGSLISPLRDASFLKRFSERLGIPAAADLTESGRPAFRIQLLDLSAQPAGRPLGEPVRAHVLRMRHAPDVICTTATSAQLEEAEEIGKAASRCSPSALRIIGGPHVSVRPEDFLRQSAYQVACIGEGVETLAELALRRSIRPEVDLAAITGIAYTDGAGAVHRNRRRTPAFHLDEYPFASRSLELFWPHVADPRQNAKHPVCVLAGFGCPHDCIFCAQRCIHAANVRERSAESIFAEVEELYAQGFRKFAFVQETFLNSKQRVSAFCDRIRKASLDIEWTVEARADQVDFDDLVRMREAGLTFIQAGVESGDPELLRGMKKSVRLDQIIRLTEWCRELEIHTTFYLLVGLPGQGWQSILRSALLVLEHTPFNRLTGHASVSIAIPYPGTRIARDRSVRIVNWDKKNWPARNPEARVDDEGTFQGEAHTETDDMTAGEIFEAWIYLDYFCHFLLHAADTDALGPAGRAKTLEHAARVFSMLECRTARDLIVRARKNRSAIARRSALAELVDQDAGAESRLRDLPSSSRLSVTPLTEFLASVTFLNGYQTMKGLRIENRAKWMKIGAILWQALERRFAALQFENDDERAGRDMEAVLDGIDDRCLDSRLARAVEVGRSFETAQTDASRKHLTAFGIRFTLEPAAGRLVIH